MKIELPKQTDSFWHRTNDPLLFPALEESMSTDIAVIGGGIAGILTAYELAEQGHSVILLEARKVLRGTIGRTTSKLSAQHTIIYDELIRRHGEEKARLYYDANMEGIERTRALAMKYQIDCDLKQQSAYVYTQSEKYTDVMKKEAEAYEKLSLDGNFTDKLPINLEIAAAVAMHNQFEFHPVNFLTGVLRALKEKGAQVFEQTIVESIEDGSSVTVKTQNGLSIECRQAVCASHFPIDDSDQFYAKNLTPEMSLATAYKAAEPFPGGMYISADPPHRTFRSMPAGGNEFILVGGGSHTPRDGSSDKQRYEEIMAFAQKTFHTEELDAYWSAHDYMTKDRMPFIGRIRPDAENVYVATGFSKWGLANAANGALLVCDLIGGRQNRYEQLLNPHRKIPDADELIEAEDAVHHAQSEKEQSAELLETGGAAVIEAGGQKTGVYKDGTGTFYYLDLHCTHLGCEVSWNDGDQTWDYPCHGSRFNAKGEVIAGPAAEPLKLLDKRT